MRFHGERPEFREDYDNYQQSEFGGYQQQPDVGGYQQPDVGGYQQPESGGYQQQNCPQKPRRLDSAHEKVSTSLDTYKIITFCYF